MAGDWIKLERATLRKPEVLQAAELLGISRREAVGLFVDYFVWLDEHLDESRDGLVTHVSRKSVEEALQCIGFAAVLERIGWASFDDEAWTLAVIHADRHNGKTAKTRALSQARMKKMRDASVTHTLRKKANQRREEKRREINLKGCATTSYIARATEQPEVNNPLEITGTKNSTPKATPPPGARWDSTDAGIDQKAVELGVKPLAGESYFDLKRRLWTLINTRALSPVQAAPVPIGELVKRLDVLKAKP